MTRVASPSLGASVLVLNRFYMAVHVISVRRAFALWCASWPRSFTRKRGSTPTTTSRRGVRSAPSARPTTIRTTTGFRRSISAFRRLRVIRLLDYDRTPKQTVRFNRRNVFARDGNHCQYCGQGFPTSELSLDHVVPRSQNGPTCWENIVCACVACNVRKGGRTPQQWHMKLIRPPVKPKRSPLLTIKLGNPKYESWKTFLNDAYWSVDLK